MANSFVRGYALLIGVGECEYPKWSLPVTVKDVTAVKEILVDPSLCGYPNDDGHIRLLCNADATCESILAGLQWLKEIADRDPEATIVVYYSGHGWSNPVDRSYYLIPHDVVPGEIEESALAGAEFTKALQSINSQKLLVILDCCHAQGVSSAKGAEVEFKLPDGANFKPPRGFLPESAKGQFLTLAQGKGVAILSSSDNHQLSLIRKDQTCSVFTYHLIDALRGAGNQVGDRVVTVMNLIDYLGKTVPVTARSEYQVEQNPQVDFEGSSYFPIALLCGGKGLPKGGFEEIAALPPDNTTSVTIASGERSVAIGGSAHGATIISGDRNIVSGGMTQINKDRARGYQTKVDGGTAYIGEFQTKGFENVPGHMQPRKPNEFHCPQCDRTGYREDVSEPVPICPVHRLPMQSQGG
jgi:Caspase domain